MTRKIKAIVFDMDGVLIDAKDWHYESLNKALEIFGESISNKEHLSVFDGLPTKTKLSILSVANRVPKSLHDFINTLKQKFVLELISTQCYPVFIHEYALSRLSREGYKMAVASNSVRNSVEIMMHRSGLMKYLAFFLSNEDVRKPKPDPEIYHMAIERFVLQPQEVIIVEDNDHGLQAARDSGANVLKVNTVKDTNYENIRAFINKLESSPC